MNSTKAHDGFDAVQAAQEAQEARKLRLLAYLQADPTHPALRLDAIACALQCEDAALALRLAKEGRLLHPGDLAWRLQEARILKAQGALAEAHALLHALDAALASTEAESTLRPIVVHNLAALELERGQAAACVARLAAWMEPVQALHADAPAVQAMAQLWLRGLHHDLQLERAVAWIEALPPDAGPERAMWLGIASLIAIDLGDLRRASEWVSACNTHAGLADRCIEVRLTQATLALLAHDGPGALRFAAAALQMAPRNGRAWSARAFACLAQSDLPSALEAFERATTFMPTHIATWLGRGWTEWLLQADAGADSARLSFERALALDRNFAESHGALAVLHAVRGEAEEARGAIERALRLDGQCASAQFALAVLRNERTPGSMAQLAQLAQRLFDARHLAMPAGASARLGALGTPKASA